MSLECSLSLPGLFLLSTWKGNLHVLVHIILLLVLYWYSSIGELDPCTHALPSSHEVLFLCSSPFLKLRSLCLYRSFQAHKEHEKMLRTHKREICELNDAWKIDSSELVLKTRIDLASPGGFGEVSKCLLKICCAHDAIWWCISLQLFYLFSSSPFLSPSVQNKRWCLVASLLDN